MRSALVKQNQPACYIWTARLLALLSKQMWTEGLAPSGAFVLPGDDGVRDETSGRSGGVTTRERLVQVFLERC